MRKDEFYEGFAGVDYETMERLTTYWMKMDGLLMEYLMWQDARRDGEMTANTPEQQDLSIAIRRHVGPSMSPRSVLLSVNDTSLIGLEDWAERVDFVQNLKAELRKALRESNDRHPPHCTNDVEKHFHGLYGHFLAPYGSKPDDGPEAITNILHEMGARNLVFTPPGQPYRQVDYDRQVELLNFLDWLTRRAREYL